MVRRVFELVLRLFTLFVLIFIIHSQHVGETIGRERPCGSRPSGRGLLKRSANSCSVVTDYLQ